MLICGEKPSKLGNTCMITTCKMLTGSSKQMMTRKFMEVFHVRKWILSELT
jgi:hypothetical protein